MTKIPIRSRIPIEAWTVAVLVTLFSMISSALLTSTDDTAAVTHAKLTPAAAPMATSALD